MPLSIYSPSTGEQGFSIRKLAAVVGVDPMTVLASFRLQGRAASRHCRSRLARHRNTGIDRRIGKTISRPSPTPIGCSRTGIRAFFHLHFRYNATGPADHISSEVVYCALRQAGLADARSPDWASRSTLLSWASRSPRPKGFCARSAKAKKPNSRRSTRKPIKRHGRLFPR